MVSVGNAEVPSHFTVYNALGAVVYRREAGAGANHPLDLSDQAQGVYLLVVRQGNASHTLKLVRE